MVILLTVMTAALLPQGVQAQVTDACAASVTVQPGDTLSSIARRITNRQAGVWQTVATLHAANPDAFIDNDPNRLLFDWCKFGIG